MKKFLTESGTLVKKKLDGTGSETELDSFSVDCYVDWTRTWAVNEDGEKIEANATVFIEPNASIDVSHKRWDFTFEGETYKLKNLSRVKKIGTNTIDHYEAKIL